MKGTSKSKKKLIEGEDFYYNERGFMVLTAKYHLENGRCCGNECVKEGGGTGDKGKQPITQNTPRRASPKIITQNSIFLIKEKALYSDPRISL
jgi:hypothetical protein